MKRHYLLLALMIILAVPGVFAAEGGARYSHEGPILLRNITVIDGLGSPTMPMRDVLLQDGRISRIEVTTMIGELPEGTRVIDGTGLTVLPGLIDAHTHIGGIDYSLSNVDAAALDDIEGIEPYRSAFRYGNADGMEGKQRYLEATLYAGVTTILELGGQSVLLRDEIADGTRLGPTIHTVGPIIEALKTTQYGVMQLSAEEPQAEIKNLLDERQEDGIEIVKLYAGITPWEARHIMTAAKKRGMRGVADFWCANQSRTIFEVSLVDSYGHGGCRELTREEVRWMADNHKFGLLTLSIFDAQSGERGWADFPERGLFNNPLIVDIWGTQGVEDYYASFLSLRAQWHEGEHAVYNLQLWGNKQSNLAFNMKNAKLMYEEGVIGLMGTDAPWPPGNWPGEGMHYELELHVRAGIPPLHAIKMATHNNALFLRRDHEIGSVERGMTADLLVVNGNPAVDISDTRHVVHVIKGGKLVNREALKLQNTPGE